MKNRIIPTLLFAITVAGCAPTTMMTEDTYGNSVRSMIFHQTADPAAAANPDPEPVAGIDGEKAEKVLAEHNANVTRPERGNNEISFKIGN